MQIEEILQRAIDMDAADIFIVAGLPVTFKCDGHQVRLSSTGNLPDRMLRTESRSTLTN